MKTKTQNARERLREVRSALNEKRDERAELETSKNEAREAWKDAHGDTPPGESVETQEFKDAEAAVAALGQCGDQIADLQREERLLLEDLGLQTPEPGGNGNGPADVSKVAPGWNAKSLLQADGYKALTESGEIHSRSKLGTHVLGEICDRETAGGVISGRGFMAADVGSDEKQGAIPADRRGIVLPNLQRLRLLDLLPAGTTDSNNVEYVQIVTLPDSAAETAEGDEKPEESFITRDAEAPVRTIAGWIKIRRQALADVAGLGTLLNTILPLSVRRRVQRQVLIGDGEDQNLLGLYNTDFVGEGDQVAGDNTADRILRAVTVVVLSDADPDFVALNPITQQNLMLMRENEADRTGAYLYGSPAAPAAPTIWGLAMTSDRSVPDDEPLVGDSMAAALLYREGVTVRVSDSDGDDFRRNRVTVLAEVRVAFPVYMPTSFATAPVPASS